MELIIIFAFMAIVIWLAKRRNGAAKPFDEALTANKFSPDYISDNHAISIDSNSKRIMLKSGKNCFRVYEPEEILSWHAGYDHITVSNNIFYKYYIEFRVKDLDNPNPKAWFGGANQERDKWLARVTTLYNNFS